MQAAKAQGEAVMAQQLPAQKREFYYEIQKRQKFRTLLLLGMLLLFYTIGIGLMYAVFVLGLTGGVIGRNLFSFHHLWVILLLAGVFAWLQWLDVKNNGAQFMLERLNGHPPESGDTYHARMAGAVDEMRIASGYRGRVEPVIVPSNAVNSFAVINAEGTAQIGITEGALARLSREEIQAMVAHEFAHVITGDALFVTFACSLGNLFQRITDMMEGDNPQGTNLDALFHGLRAAKKGGSLLNLGTASFVRILSLFISRQREYLADATAVEMTRNPEALARVIYRAHTGYSFLGGAGETYSPIFLVAPNSEGTLNEEGSLDRVFGTHPSTMERLKRLSGMAHKSILGIARSIEEQDRLREESMTIMESVEELMPETTEKPMPAETVKPAAPLPGEKDAADAGNAPDAPLWEIRNGAGGWAGPFTTREIFAVPWLTPMIYVRRAGTDQCAPAQSYPELREAFHDPEKRGHKMGSCPRCGTRLENSFYEGAPVRICPGCRGKLVPSAAVMRIIARREKKPSARLLEKAYQWLKENEFNRNMLKGGPKTVDRNLVCPLCARPMMRAAFSYQYFMEVDRCEVCKQVWFDADELEIIQILIEQTGH